MTELRHGYTLADLHAYARLAVQTAGWYAIDWHDRYHIAWSAIAEHLYAAEHWPPHYDLVRTGQRAIRETVTDHLHHHGYYRAHNLGAAAGPASSPAFITYWLDSFGTAPSPEHRIVESLTLTQVWPTLTAGQQEALTALAALGDYQTAAASLGYTDAAFKSQISRARRRFLAAWHEGETPSRVWGCDRRAGQHAGQRRAGGTAMDAVRRRRRVA